MTLALTLLTRPGCHLCDAMKDVAERAAADGALAITELDISTRPDLESRFGHEIPVLLHGETVIARTRISTSDLIDRLHRFKEASAR